MDKLQTHIRWMTRRDYPQVMEIENECFEFPWTEEDLTRCIRTRNYIGIIAEESDRVLGYAVYELQTHGIHILNLGIHPKFRRRKIASQLIEKLFGKMGVQRRTRLTLEVRESNVAAQVFFRSLGFRATKILRNYYDDTDEDAYCMIYKFKGTNDGNTEEENNVSIYPGAGRQTNQDVS
jgi:[ribosomal protein S18]-alanine N-acetyltransferase